MNNNIVVFAYSLVYPMKKEDMMLEKSHFILTIENSAGWGVTAPIRFH
jgi:hypothetical protein